MLTFHLKRFAKRDTNWGQPGENLPEDVQQNIPSDDDEPDLFNRQEFQPVVNDDSIPDVYWNQLSPTDRIVQKEVILRKVMQIPMNMDFKQNVMRSLEADIEPRNNGLCAVCETRTATNIWNKIFFELATFNNPFECIPQSRVLLKRICTSQPRFSAVKHMLPHLNYDMSEKEVLRAIRFQQQHGESIRSFTTVRDCDSMKTR